VAACLRAAAVIVSAICASDAAKTVLNLLQ
jgi:hypothetical protein